MRTVVVLLTAVLLVVTVPVLASENVTSVLIEDFNEAWTYTASENLDTAKAKITVVDDGARNDLLYPDEAAGKAKKSMGFKCGFYNRGYNHVTFTPAKPITLPGRAKKIQIWVMGLKYNWTLELWVEDHRGMTHKIEMGSLNYAGWQSMTRDLPWYIPQQESAYPADKPIKLTKMILRAHPDERIDRFYFYADQIRVMTDIYEQPFDGLDLIKKSGW